MTLRAPAPRQRRITAATVSGWVVAARSGFLSKATFGLMTTTSPFWMKWPTPPIVSRAALAIVDLGWRLGVSPQNPGRRFAESFHRRGRRDRREVENPSKGEESRRPRSGFDSR